MIDPSRGDAMSAAGRAKGMRLLGHSVLDGSPDALQVMVGDGWAYVAHPFSGGFSVVDVAEPSAPRVVHREAAPPGTMTLHLQLAEGLLLCTNEADFATAQALAQTETDGASLEFSAGVRIYDVSRPGSPREISFLSTGGYGVHRVYWAGGRWATASVRHRGSPDYTLVTLDLGDPAHPRVAHRWEPEGFAALDRSVMTVGLHHAIHATDGRLYGAWRDGGVAIWQLDAAGLPKLECNAPAQLWSGAQTHTTLPLPSRGLVVVLDEALTEDCSDGVGGLWILAHSGEGSSSSQLRVISQLPVPQDVDYCALPGRFGPHNLHENRPGSFVSESMLFCTYQNAGLRSYDISNAQAPVETGYFVQQTDARVLDPRPGTTSTPRTDSADVFVSAEGLAYLTDMNDGLRIVEVTVP